jgi:hypothetical protein
MSMLVWLRSAEPNPPLRLVLEGQGRHGSFYRSASVTSRLNDRSPPDEWQPYLLHVDTLPTQELQELQVGFDLAGPGEVWIDEVRLFEFTPEEQEQLFKIIALADFQLRHGMVGDCYRLLDSYWARFLREHVSRDDGAVADVSSRATTPVSTRRKTRDRKRTMTDRMRGIWPRWRQSPR